MCPELNGAIPYPESSPKTINPCSGPPKPPPGSFTPWSGGLAEISMDDNPHSPYPNTKYAAQEFESCVVCLDGPEYSRKLEYLVAANRINIASMAVYGCVRWGQTIDVTGRKYRRYMIADQTASVSKKHGWAVDGGAGASLKLTNIVPGGGAETPSNQWKEAVRAKSETVVPNFIPAM